MNKYPKLLPVFAAVAMSVAAMSTVRAQPADVQALRDDRAVLVEAAGPYAGPTPRRFFQRIGNAFRSIFGATSRSARLSFSAVTAANVAMEEDRQASNSVISGPRWNEAVQASSASLLDL